mgnify:CR=1 FL=1
MRFRQTLHACWLAVLLSLSACGGGGDSGSGDVTATDAEVKADVVSSNITPYGLSGTARWTGSAGAVPTVNVYIPTPTTDLETGFKTKVQSAITSINRKLNGYLTLTVVDTEPSSTTDYIRVSFQTAYVPANDPSPNYEAYCANVSTGANLQDEIDADSNGSLNQVVWVNLGNRHCTLSQDEVTHEMGHALGLAVHFNGFTDTVGTSSAFWDVLTTLYGNPVLTTESNLVVRRAAN